MTTPTHITWLLTKMGALELLLFVAALSVGNCQMELSFSSTEEAIQQYTKLCTRARVNNVTFCIMNMMVGSILDLKAENKRIQDDDFSERQGRGRNSNGRSAL